MAAKHIEGVYNQATVLNLWYSTFTTSITGETLPANRKARN